MFEVSMRTETPMLHSPLGWTPRVLFTTAAPSFAMVACALALSGGCTSSSSASTAASGGQSSNDTGAGGATGAGGVPAIAGATATGGIPGTGGLSATGGLPGTGGLAGAGGSAGGNSGTGGVSRTGGLPSTGGVTGAGGVAGTGGVPGTAGSINTGGQPVPDAGSVVADAPKDDTVPRPDGPTGGTIPPDARNAGGSPDLGRGGSGGSGGSTPSGGSTTNNTGGATTEVPLDPSLLAKCTGTNPINCALNESNGNYNVTVELGSATAASTTRVRAETRRIELQPTDTAAGAYFRYTFTVNVRAESHDGYSAPGGVLNLSLDGTSPALHGVGVAPASVPTIFIAGDSTVCDWDPPTYNPFAPDGTDVAGWGQELSQFLRAGIAVANYADSGETAGSFYSKFYPPAKAAMKQGDYLFVQFGHNDMKSTSDSANYRANLLKYVTDARAKSVTPVLITPVSRSSGANFNGLDQTMRDLATAEKVAIIDLSNLSLTYYGTLSSSAKSALFVDGTHFHEPGATQIANLVAQAMKGLGVGLESYVK